MRSLFLAVAIVLTFSSLTEGVRAASEDKGSGPEHTFALGDSGFILDGKPFLIRAGELHYSRIPRDYWRHRLQMLRAMGCNAVGCYLFWNYHEREPGTFKWDGNADVAAFCKMAQEEGLWVILRPGPYCCAEWEGGGAPWWLMKDDMKDGRKPISMRSSDPRWIEPCTRWIREVGRVMAPLQITRGGPILLVQVENEYGLHGNDVNYIRALRQATLDAGFDVPLYACNPPRVTQNGFVPELFQCANFGGDPEQRFGIIRQFQPKGPLMCSEYYPGWFDTWGQKHQRPKSDREFFGPIDWMLEHNASFSLYMAHGGTSFGGWTGCRNPFVPNVTSYDYGAPITEQGRAAPTFAKMRGRCAKYLNAGETIPVPPADIPVTDYGKVAMEAFAPVDVLTAREAKIKEPVYMEQLGQGFGLVSYETWIEPGQGGKLSVTDLHDFGYVFLDGERLGTFDRRHRGLRFAIARSDKRRRLQILVEAMGRINSSQGMEDRKGLNGRVRLERTELKDWTVRLMPIDPDGNDPWLERCRSAGEATFDACGRPALYRGRLALSAADARGDTWLDLSGWTKGIVWVNGHHLGRFWNIGPQQTLFVPGCWLKAGENTVVVLDFFGPTAGATVEFTDRPVLDALHPDRDFNLVKRQNETFLGGREVASGSFPDSDEAQVVLFKEPVRGAFFTLQITDTYDAKKLATIAEFDFLDRDGNPITSMGTTISGVSSEETVREDGSAESAIDGQVEAYWITSSRSLPHWIEFMPSVKSTVYGFRYTPRQNKSIGRIKSWAFFVR